MIKTMLRERSDEEKTFVMERRDIGPVLVDYLNVSSNRLSPFTEVISSYQKGSAAMSPSGEALAKNPLFTAMAPTLASPAFLLKNRLGGGMTPFEEMRIFAGPDFGDALVVSALGGGDDYVLRIFENQEQYAAWWIDSFAGKNDQVVSNYIPPLVEPTVFFLILHAIDWYRRVSYQNALDYAPGAFISVKPEDFSGSMERAIKSHDLRWLLPAFVMLLPGLDRYDFVIEAEKAAKLHSMNFFNNAKDPKTGAEVFVFGEAGRAMGVEFMRTWMLGAGFELLYLNGQTEQSAKQFFIAPTALANHYIEMVSDEQGQPMVNHQPYTANQLKNKLTAIFSEAFSGVSTAPAAQAASLPEQRCANCQALLEPGAKFCASCGTPIAQPVESQSIQMPAEENSRFCKKCQAELPDGSKFCTNCGTPA